MTTSTRLPIVGTKFRGAHAEMILGMLPLGTRLTLQSEPENRFDPNAKAVVLAQSDLDSETLGSMKEALLRTADENGRWHLGYIPRTAAAHPKISAIKTDIPCKFRISPTGIPQVEFEKTGD